MEQFFKPNTPWGTDPSKIQCSLIRFANENRFEVRFRGNSKTVNTVSCSFPDCPWFLQFNFSKKLDPPAWKVGKHLSGHSAECLENSRYKFDDINPVNEGKQKQIKEAIINI